MPKEKSQLRIGILLNYLNIGLGNLIPIFYTPVMLSLLGQSEYGLYKLSSSVTSYLSLVSFGLGSAIARYLIKAREEEGKEAEEKVLGLFITIFGVIAVLTLVIGILMTMNLERWYGNSLSAAELERMQLLVFLMVCNTAIGFSQSPYISVVSTHERFVFLQITNILTTCIGPLLNLIALYLGYASVGMAVVSLAMTCVLRFVYLLYVRRALHMRPRYGRVDRGFLKEILAFSFWIFISNVVGQLYNATDTILIGAVPALATTGVAVYNVGAMFNSIVFNLTIGVSSLLSPKTNRMVFSGATDDELTDLAIRVGRIQGYIFALVVSGFIAFGKPFIHFYAGAEYAEAYWVAVLMMIPNMIPLVQSVCLNVIVARNKHRFRSIVYLGIAVLNVAGTWVLMQYMGIIGAALMTGLALVIGQGFVMNWYYWKKTGLNMGRFWKSLCSVYMFPCIMCMVVLFLSKIISFYSIWMLFAGIIVYTLVYCVASWLLVMNEYEKGLIVGMLHKRK